MYHRPSKVQTASTLLAPRSCSLSHPIARFAMPLEERRRQLMSINTDWGVPCLLSMSKSGSAAPEEPGTSTDLNKALQDATIAAPNMEYEVTQQTRPKIFVSSKDWSVGGLLQQGESRFKEVPRVSALAPLELLSAIQQHEESGIPLIIEDWHKHPKWPKDKFTLDWFREHGQQGAVAVLSALLGSICSTVRCKSA